MLHREFYTVDEAANQLDVDAQTIFQQAKLGNISLSIVKKNYGMVLCADMSKDIISYDNLIKLLIRDEKNINKEAVESLSVYLNMRHQFKVLNDEKVLVCSYEKPYLNVDPVSTVWLRGSDSRHRFYYYEDKPREITQDDLVISHNELQRLITEFHNRSSYEQLQAENESLKQCIAELEAVQSNDTKQPIQQQREQAILFWVEGVGRDMVMTMTKQQIHNALKKIDPIFHFSDFDKFWKKQQIIKLEAGKPTR